MNEFELEEEIKQRDSTIKTILMKYDQADEERIECKRMNVELEKKVEHLESEIDNLKKTAVLEKLFADHELRKVCNELIKVKNEIKEKVIEQNKMINLLADKMNNQTATTEPTNNTIIISTFMNNLNESVENLIEDENEFNTMIQANNLDIYECPKCEIAINSNFKEFQIHVTNCSADKRLCPMCFKFFNKEDEEQFLQHVGNHNERE